ncbi:S8 family serine peptidase [Azospirillum brasilense]|nr:S8 family serine peptidase [Azospirillum brasilense]
MPTSVHEGTMSGDLFYVRTHDKVTYVAAKFLKDDNGNYIKSPNPEHSEFMLFSGQSADSLIGTNSNGYIKVPYDFNMGKALSFGSEIKTVYNQISVLNNDLSMFSIGADLMLIYAFHAGGFLDIQRTYNGMSGNNVPAFIDGASYIFGAVGAAAGFSLDNLIFGGGVHNLVQKYFRNNPVDTSGEWWNSPRNIYSMSLGYQDKSNRPFSQASIDTHLGNLLPFDHLIPSLGSITKATLDNSVVRFTSIQSQDTALDGFLLGGQANGNILLNSAGAIIRGDQVNGDSTGNVGASGTPFQIANSIAAGLINPFLGNVQNPDQSPALQLLASGDITSTKFAYGLDSVLSNAVGGHQFPVDPLILDLDGDGAEAYAWYDGVTFFDSQDDGNNLRHHTGWVGADDGLLAWDVNGNGTIDGLNELVSVAFKGGHYNDALAALRTLDGNNDGRVDSADAAWSHLRVWRDADGDGITDPDELLTLDSLSIRSLSTASTGDRGEAIGNNPVRGRSSYTRSDGTVRETVAVDFRANSNAITETALAGGTTLVTTLVDPAVGGAPVQRGALHLGSGAHVVNLSAGTLNGAAVLTSNGTRPDAAYAGAGADTITAAASDTKSYWMGGGTGILHLQGGGGNDVLFANAATLRSGFVNGGGGIDLLRVLGNESVTVNLADKDLEVVLGGGGDDILIGGDVEGQFIHGGDGDDMLGGGWSDDALQGGDGDDFLSGAAGDDVLRGGAGRDILYGGVGDDLLYGEDGDDLLIGEAGNNILEGGRGDDRLLGTGGWAVAQFSGSYSDYIITRNGDGSIKVADRRAGRDGTDVLVDVAALSFKDLSQIAVANLRRMPVNDTVRVTAGQASYTLSAAQILANDLNFEGLPLRLREIVPGSVVGGSAVLQANGSVVFTRAAGFQGVMSFQYRVADSAGIPGMAAVQVGTGLQAEMKGTVSLVPDSLPADPLLAQQWYVNPINVAAVWGKYSGAGVKVAVLEPGNVSPDHPDLIANYAGSVTTTGQPGVDFVSAHATLVAGVIAASRDGAGAVGVAYGAELHSVSVSNKPVITQDGSVGYQELSAAALRTMRNYDVVNNSWSFNTLVPYNSSGVRDIDGNIVAVTEFHRQAAALGRNGKGTVIVAAAGNQRQANGNTGVDPLISNPWTITVAAINRPGDIGSLVVDDVPFSNPGASILVAAPGNGIASTALLVETEDGSVFGDDYALARGTSFATPIVSGVVALMLEANPNLRWFDVQAILANSAKAVPLAGGNTVVYNGATTWNGGGFRLDAKHEYGFGEVDARAAVRLAETWNTGTGSVSASAGSVLGLGNIVLADDTRLTTNPFQLTPNIMGFAVDISQLTMIFNITSQSLRDVRIVLRSPNGTESVMLDRPNVDAFDGMFSVTTMRHRGELDNDAGGWQLIMEDWAGNGKSSTLRSVQFQVNGGFDSADDTYIYTDEFASLGGGARSILSDANGVNTINASAVSNGSVINLNAGTVSTIAGRQVTLAAGSVFANAYGGDGNDTLQGNMAANLLSGGAGNDILEGGAGPDTLNGGAGTDTASFRSSNGSVSVNLMTGTGQGGDATGDVLIGIDNLIGSDYGHDTLIGNAEANLLIGGNGNDLIVGGSGNDTLIGGPGEDTLDGGDGFDTVSYEEIHDNLGGYLSGAAYGYHASGDRLTRIERLISGRGNDIIYGNEYDNFIIGGAGDDTLIGGIGADTLYGDGGSDTASYQYDFSPI